MAAEEKHGAGNSVWECRGISGREMPGPSAELP